MTFILYFHRNTLRYLKILGFGLPAAAGSLLGYAWYDPNFRQQIQANIPYAKEILEGILPESDTATPPARCVYGLKKLLL